MKLKEKWGTQTWDAETRDLLRDVVLHGSTESYARIEVLVEVVARLIDHMNLHVQQKLDIIELYSNWELDK
jgi:Mn-containing catalase